MLKVKMFTQKMVVMYFKPPKFFFLMYFSIVETCFDGVCKFSIVATNVSNSFGINTKGVVKVAIFSILPPFQGFIANHKCFIPLHCKSLFTFIVSFSPIIIFKIFLAKFCSQCMTFNVYWTISSYDNHNTISDMINSLQN